MTAQAAAEVAAQAKAFLLRRSNYGPRRLCPYKGAGLLRHQLRGEWVVRDTYRWKTYCIPCWERGRKASADGLRRWEPPPAASTLSSGEATASTVKWLEAAFREAAAINKRSLRYIQAITGETQEEFDQRMRKPSPSWVPTEEPRGFGK